MDDHDPRFEALLDFARLNRGFDFTAYKRSSLMRRINKRMHTVGIADYEEYLNYLEVHPDEFGALFNTILINVTSFYRDRPAWDYLADQVLPRLLDARRSEPLRLWSAGCASGEETYTLAMVLGEVLCARLGEEQGEEAFRRRVKIYATDVDEEALYQARHASYPAEALAPIPPELQEKYFERNGSRFVFRTDWRRSIIFGRHDLIQDAPISRLDLLVCRNTLMYFNAEAQRRVLARFHFALNAEGYLFLGKAEMLLTHAHLFSPVDLKHRIFTKVAKENLRDRMVILTQAGDAAAANQLIHYVRLREAAFDAAPGAQVVIDHKGNLVLANQQAHAFFNIRAHDLGRPFYEMELSYRPVDLRSLIDQAHLERDTVVVRGVERHLPDGDVQHLEVRVIPLRAIEGQPLGTAISFLDLSRYHRLQEDLERSRQELETTNEELQSSNEELETTNEELHSTVEEMETMNEELQSTNEELDAINNELRVRSLELERSKAFLESILSSAQAGVVVVDEQMEILLWNRQAEELWGLRAEEVVGRGFLSLDIGLPVEQLAERLQQFLEGASQGVAALDAVNRRGRALRCVVRFSSLHLDESRQRRGAVLLMEVEDDPS